MCLVVEVLVHGRVHLVALVQLSAGALREHKQKKRPRRYALRALAGPVCPAAAVRGLLRGLLERSSVMKSMYPVSYTHLTLPTKA